MHVPEEEKYLNTEAELRDMLVGYLGGRAAEEIVFDTVTTGAANDIEKATDLAKAMVTQYGMSKKFGLVGFATVESKYLSGTATLNCSDTTAAEIDAEVVAILKESYDKALSMLRENREIMDKLAEYLIEKETITGKEFMKIFRELKGIPEPVEEPKEETKDVATEAQEQPVDETPIVTSEIDVVVDDTTMTTQEEAQVEEAVPDTAEDIGVQQEGEVGRFSGHRL